jgi:hypothetical protein
MTPGPGPTIYTNNMPAGVSHAPIPSGVRFDANGFFVDINDAVNHVNNPALLYRGLHGNRTTEWAGTYD